jgi:putative SOS response-associated peptidase YedK
MCGRYTLTASPEVVQQAFDLATLPILQPRYNIAPTQPVPVITSEKPRELTIVSWGLIPSWSKDASGASKLINARAETVEEKPSFRAAFKYRRCLIPADGFFEWQSVEDSSKKKPQFIYVGEREVFAFAGLWERWQSPGGDEVQTCTILTTEPNQKIQRLHHRMAVILDKDDYAAWLSPDSKPDELKHLLRAYPEERINLYEISTLVNNARIDTPDILQPVQPPPQQPSLF